MKIVFHAYKYQGRGIDFGRVLYGWGRKYWVRLGPYILSVESDNYMRDAR